MSARNPCTQVYYHCCQVAFFRFVVVAVALTCQFAVSEDTGTFFAWSRDVRSSKSQPMPLDVFHEALWLPAAGTLCAYPRDAFAVIVSLSIPAKASRLPAAGTPCPHPSDVYTGHLAPHCHCVVLCTQANSWTSGPGNREGLAFFAAMDFLLTALLLVQLPLLQVPRHPCPAATDSHPSQQSLWGACGREDHFTAGRPEQNNLLKLYYARHPSSGCAHSSSGQGLFRKIRNTDTHTHTSTSIQHHTQVKLAAWAAIVGPRTSLAADMDSPGRHCLLQGSPPAAAVGTAAATKSVAVEVAVRAGPPGTEARVPHAGAAYEISQLGAPDLPADASAFEPSQKVQKVGESFLVA
eukprot:1161008-Pelagomonas_calceolata.AAC.1